MPIMIELILWCFLMAVVPWVLGLAWGLFAGVQTWLGPGGARALAHSRRDEGFYRPLSRDQFRRHGEGLGWRRI
jgi:hypothetical protein